MVTIVLGNQRAAMLAPRYYGSATAYRALRGAYGNKPFAVGARMWCRNHPDEKEPCVKSHIAETVNFDGSTAPGGRPAYAEAVKAHHIDEKIEKVVA